MRVRIHRAFTLIELLVVIVIIGALIGLLLPALASARQSAVGTLCMANQSQLVIAVQNYAIENKGQIPFGPMEPGSGALNGVDDFYIINGMTTSQISDKFGNPVGAGVMLDDYLSDTPEILFCPGADQPIKAKDELERFGVGSVISGYTYRHASNTRDEQWEAFATGVPLQTIPQLDALGTNTNGDDITALFIDNNFLANAISGAFYRSNHDLRFANVAFTDGRVEQRDNTNGDYNAEVIGTDLFSGIKNMRAALENAEK